MAKIDGYGIIVNASSDKFTVYRDGEYYALSARGVLKIKSSGIKVGDKVEFDGANILSVLPRKNFLPRLNTANIDCVNIVISPMPRPDLLLVDKLIVESNILGCRTIITVNKSDIDDGLARYIFENYSRAVDGIVAVSAKNGEGIEDLRAMIKGKLTVFCGQSAVGKTSALNALFDLSEKINSVSEKTGRGRHTTTRRKIIVDGDDFVVDTPGFSTLGVTSVDSAKLADYYTDFAAYNGKCYYIGCTHSSEPDCLVKNAVLRGEISRDRYERYLLLLKEIREYEKRKY